MRKFFTLQEKRDIVDEAWELPGIIKAVARKYGIGASNIRRWKANFHDFDNRYSDVEGLLSDEGRLLLKKQTFHLGKSRSNSATEFAAIRLLYDQLRGDDRACSIMLLAAELKRLSGHVASLSVIQQRVARWCTSQNIVYRRITHKAQNTRYVLSVMQEYLQYINAQFLEGSYHRASIVNIDETNIYFDMAGGLTLADKGAKTISLRTNGSSMRCTVLLGVTMSGEKLAPLVVFKGVPDARIQREFNNQQFAYPPQMVYCCQAKAWVDESVFALWIREVWKPWTISHDSQPSYLLMDEFQVHLMATSLNAIKDCGTAVDFICGGYTSKLQVLDVGVNKPFKGFVRNAYEDWMVAHPHGTKVKWQDVAQWVWTAWLRVSQSTILNTWNAVGYIASD